MSTKPTNKPPTRLTVLPDAADYTANLVGLRVHAFRKPNPEIDYLGLDLDGEIISHGPHSALIMGEDGKTIVAALCDITFLNPPAVRERLAAAWTPTP